MTKEEQRRYLLIYRIKDNCYEDATKHLVKYEQQDRADAIDEYSNELWRIIELATINCKLDLTIDDLHNLEMLIKGLAEDLKEQNNVGSNN